MGAGKAVFAGRGRRIGLLIAGLLALLLLSPVSAHASVPKPLVAKVPEDGQPGEEAGRFSVAEGIAADGQLPGHIFVVDQGNARIDEFTSWGEFVKAWGWNVNTSSPEEKLQTCTAITECQAGSSGGGAGQFNVPQSIAVDGAGNVYVAELGNHRVQKFDPDGGPGGEAKFVLTLGYKVNKTHELGSEVEANLCTAASGDDCQAGAPGVGPGKLGGSSFRRKLAASSADNALFVGEGESIQRFNLGGGFEKVLPVPHFVLGLAVDGAGDLYVALQGEAEVRKLNSGGAPIPTPKFPPENVGEQPETAALDGQGNLYVQDGPFGPEPARILSYDAAGNCLSCGADGEGGKPGFDRTLGSQLVAIAATSACGSNDIYPLHFKPSPEESFFRAFGDPPNPALCPPPKRPPAINDQYASTVETDEAILRAKINPQFWSGSVGTTTYWVQYATQGCFDSGGWEAECAQKAPAKVLGGGSVNEDVAVTVALEGLLAGTTYRYRFAAEGSGAPGQEIVGVGGKPGSPGEDASFTTFRVPTVDSCPANETFRVGPSALLPDCRAYEMVSPIDKEGGDIAVLDEFQTFLPAVLGQSATSGGRVAYGSVRSFGDAASAPLTTQYIASRREGEGWFTHAISPPRGKNVFGTVAITFDTEFKLFTPDLCGAWLESYADLTGGPPVPPGIVNLYSRTDNECGGPTFAPLNAVIPPVAEGERFQIELQGVSADGRTAIFQADDELAEGGTQATLSPEGSNLGPKQLYGARDGVERFLCVLPGGSPWTGPCTGGGGGNGGQGRSREGNVTGAISDDGTRVFWTAAVGAPGRIYLRENPFAEGAECAEEGSACTVAVSKAAEEEVGSTNAAQFWAAAADGSAALFTVKGGLFEYRVGDESTHLIASDVRGLLGQSEDASKVYLVSDEAIGGANAEGKSATLGEPNLYFYEDEGFQFIGTLGSGDFSGLSPAALMPLAHTSRVSADGNSAAFMSTVPLTGYDNTDAASGKANAEVFLYGAAANGGQGQLVCASCNPSGARSRGAATREGQLSIQAAAKIPVPENMFYPSRVLSEGGQRLFFESRDPLTLRDTNGQWDVYQWESPATPGCSQSSSSYSPSNGGCVLLISSGQSPSESKFLDASPSGGDIFFTTLSSLLPQDPGLVDLYDARVGGGLPAPPIPPPPCEGEDCQHPAAAPPISTPASEAYEGPEDQAQNKPAKGKCGKGRHRVKGKCVKKKSHKRSPRHLPRRAEK